MWMPGASIGARNIVAPAGPSGSSSLRAMTIASLAPTAPVISHLVPSMTKSPRCRLASRRAVVSSIDGSAPAPGAGSVIMKHERIAPAASGRSHSSFCRSVGDLLQQVHVGFVGGEDVHRDRRQRRIAGRLEHHRLAAVVEPQPAPFAADMRRQQPGASRQRDQLEAEFLGRAVCVCRLSLSRGMISSRTKRSVRSFSSSSSSGIVKSMSRPRDASAASSSTPPGGASIARARQIR